MEEYLNSVLAARRRRLGLTQVELAARLGRPQSLISRWESRDRAMTPVDLRDVADALELSLDELLDGGVPHDRRRRSSRGRPAVERARLGREVALARRARAADPVRVAKAAGLSPYRLWRIEGGVDMTLFEFAGVCRAIGVRPSAVLAAMRPVQSTPRLGDRSPDSDQAVGLTSGEDRTKSPGASLKAT